tara:strand:- start:153 stop:770 length:618 start_codon:yes stop_codon:yes gene_type:complete
MTSFWAEHWPEIDRWRYEEGLTYKQIQDRCDELFGRHPSKGTLSPHFSQQSFENNKRRAQEFRATLRGKISRAISAFQDKKLERREADKTELTSLRQIIAKKLKKFKKKGGDNVERGKFSIQEAMDFLVREQELDEEKWTAISPLTGKTLNLKEEFHLDHWDPDAGNGLENLAILSRQENMLKSDFTIPELVDLIKDVIKIHGNA